MRERFTDEEWCLVRQLPIDAFVITAWADGEATEAEVDSFMAPYVRNAPDVDNALHREIIVAWRTGGAAPISESISGIWHEESDARKVRWQRTRAVLQDKLEGLEYVDFITSIWASAVAVAEASSDKSRVLQREKPAISDEEVKNLGGFAVFWHVDLSGSPTELIERILARRRELMER